MGTLYAAYLAATIVLVITPGATTAVVVKNTLAHGHRAGVLAALGAAAANTVHARLAGLGLWELVGRWPQVLDALRIGGAGYLAWLGLRSLRRVWRDGPSHARSGGPCRVQSDEPSRVRSDEPSRVRSDGTSVPSSSRRGFVEGLTINLLNPAIISFYMAVVPTFMPPSPPRYYSLPLATTHVGLAFVCHAGWATAFHVLRRIFARPGVRVAFELGTAAALLWLAARVIARSGSRL